MIFFISFNMCMCHSFTLPGILTHDVISIFAVRWLEGQQFDTQRFIMRGILSQYYPTMYEFFFLFLRVFYFLYKEVKLTRSFIFCFAHTILFFSTHSPKKVLYIAEFLCIVRVSFKAKSTFENCLKFIFSLFLSLKKALWICRSFLKFLI